MQDTAHELGHRVNAMTRQTLLKWIASDANEISLRTNEILVGGAVASASSIVSLAEDLLELSKALELLGP